MALSVTRRENWDGWRSSKFDKMFQSASVCGTRHLVEKGVQMGESLTPQ